jgi:type IV pilus assembly protein PilB
MVGEIRDEETARIAIQAAMTGHLVLSTLHTNDAPSSITRMINIGVEPYLIGAALNGVLAQRLVRRICPHCRRPAEVSDQLLEESGLSPSVYRDHQFFEGAGCLECNGTGFLGRLAVSELLDLSDRIRELILDRRPGSEIRRAAKEEGMRFLRESALEKALGGWSTLREINRFTFVD